MTGQSGEPGGVQVDSDSVWEGEDIEFKYTGNDVVRYSVDGGDWIEVPYDPDTGRGTISVPPGASLVFIADSNVGSQEAVVEILRLSRRS